MIRGGDVFRNGRPRTVMCVSLLVCTSVGRVGGALLHPSSAGSSYSSSLSAWAKNGVAGRVRSWLMLRCFRMGFVGAGAGLAAGEKLVLYGPGNASVLVLR